MTESHREEIGVNWIIAIAALLVLLVVGIVFYLRMSAPLKGQSKRIAFARPSSLQVGYLEGYYGHNMRSLPATVGRNWV